MTSKSTHRYSPELRERAVRMVLEQRGEYKSEWETIRSIAPKIGCSPDSLRAWLRQHERDSDAGDGGLTTDERQRLKELERENRELRRRMSLLRRNSRFSRCSSLRSSRSSAVRLPEVVVATAPPASLSC